MVLFFSDVLDSLNTGSLQHTRDFFLVAGLFYIAKITLKIIGNLYTGFKTFLLPLIWHQDFQNKYGPWAVVTGCSKGIGLCYAQELAKKGMNLVLIARKAELLNKIAEELRNQYDVQVEVIIADFGKGANIYSSIEEKLVGKDIGILVNNVGVATDGIKYFHEASEDSLWNMINVNIGSMTLMCKMILPKMEERKRGAVINVASVASFVPNPLMTMYAATKAYVNFFSRGLAYEYGDKGITVQCVCPGPVATDMLRDIVKNEMPPSFEKILVPTDTLYTSIAMKTLGFSDYTTGYWKHSLLYQFGLLTVHPAMTYLGNKQTMNEQKLKKGKEQ